MTLRKREDAGNRKRNHHIALCGKLAMEEAMELSLREATESMNAGIDNHGVSQEKCNTFIIPRDPVNKLDFLHTRN
jgi:hypothetical protein